MAAKDNSNVELSEELKGKFQDLSKDFDMVEAQVLKKTLELREPVYKKRSEMLSTVPDFWRTALNNHMSFSIFLDQDDNDALQYLTNVYVHRVPKDPREVKIEFTFKENPYFSNTTLTKEFVLEKGEASSSAEGVSDEEMIKFDFYEHTKPIKTKIDWKSDEKNLAKVHPPHGDVPEDEEYEPGSFFASFFESETKTANGIGGIIVDDIWPNAISYYTGDFESDFEDDEDDEDEEDDEDDDQEIDLEDEPPKKKNKSG